MPFVIKIKDTKLEIEKKQYKTKISINTLYVEKGIQVADIINSFNTSLAEAELRMQANLDAEAQLRIDADSAFSSYIVNLETSVNDSFAAVNTTISTLTTDVSALAESITTLETTVNGTINIRLEEISRVYAGYFDFAVDPLHPNYGDLKLVSGITYQYLGGSLGPLNDGWVLYNDTSSGVANQVKGWVAGSSSLVVNPSTKEVVGWQYGDGSGFDSVFKISADYIELAGTTTFSDFAYKDMSNVTTIDGGKISTNTLDASAIKSETLTGNMIYGGVIYNLGGSGSNYTMKIDLTNGEIHIK